MGIATTLAAIVPTTAELNNAAATSKDLSGMLMNARIKTSELIANLKAISNALPPGDPNIASIATIITALS